MSKTESQYSTLDLSRFLDAISIPLGLTLTQHLLVSRIIQRLTFGARGLILDLSQQNEESISEYQQALSIKQRADISHAFTRLEELQIIESERLTKGAKRRLHPNFIRNLRLYAGVGSHTSKDDWCSLTHQSSVPSHTSQVCPDTPAPLYRRLDERIDERMDGRESPKTPPIEGGDKMSDGSYYAAQLQNLYHGKNRYLSQPDFEKLNALFKREIGKRKEPEIGEFVVFYARRHYMNPSQRRQISLKGVMTALVEWDESEEKASWVSSLGKIVSDIHPSH